MNDDALRSLAEQVGTRLRAHQWTLATAESCTGGWIAKVFTDIEGSSDWFDRGFVTYSNAAKQDLLDVRAQTLESYGAVSEQTAGEMALGALHHSGAQISVAVTGIAGPGGGTREKPVGTVWLAWSARDRATQTRLVHLDGDRDAVRRQSVQLALAGVLDVLRE